MGFEGQVMEAKVETLVNRLDRMAYRWQQHVASSHKELKHVFEIDRRWLNEEGGSCRACAIFHYRVGFVYDELMCREGSHDDPEITMQRAVQRAITEREES